MGLLDIFRRSPSIRNAEALADFIDRNAAFVVQKGIYEYSRARAGHYAKVLFSEPEFQAAANGRAGVPIRSGLPWWPNWSRAFCVPRRVMIRQAQADALECACDVGLRSLPGAGGDRRRRPGPSSAPSLDRRLKLIGLHPAKRAKDIPEQFAESYFDLMPIHEKLRGRDFLATRNYLRVTMINIHGEFTERLDRVAVAHSLRGCLT